MEKKLLPLFLFVLFFNSFYAQSDKYTQKVAEQTCECLSKEKIEPFTREKYEMVLVRCLFSADGLNEAMKENKLDLSKGQDAGRELGMKIGLKMIDINCEVYMDYSLKLVEEQNAANEDAANKADITSGLFEGIDKSGDFAYLLVKDSEGRTYKFLWMDYFEGSELFMGEAAESFKGKEIEVEWTEKEVYLPRLNDYFRVKFIQSVTLF